MSTVWLVLPAFNEEKSLPALLERVVPVARDLAARGAPMKVVVVDDGSTDGTIMAAEGFRDRLDLTVVPHGTNQNLGAAMRTGFGFVLERGGADDLIATMDADNTHDPALIPAMLDAVAEADVVIASRYVKGGEEVGLSAVRKVLSRGASTLLKVVTPVRGARDYTCGYRLYRASALRSVRDAWDGKLVEEAGFTCMAEVLLKLGRNGARVTEVPLVLRYDLKEGASKMKVVRTIMGYFKLARRIRKRRPAPAA